MSGTRARLVLSQWVPEDRSAVAALSAEMGSLRGARHTETRPTLTRALVGGAGTGATRVWRVVTTTASEAAAQRWGGHVEGFVDAPGIYDLAELDARGQTAIREALAQDTFELEASQAPGMRVWEVARLGDKVAVVLTRGGARHVEPLRALRLTADQGGVRVTPIVGDPDGATPDRRVGRLVRQARRELRTIQTSRSTT